MKMESTPLEKKELSRMMLEEAAKEGWPYSAEDVDFFFDYPGNHFFALRVDGKLAGCVLRHQSSSLFQGKKIWLLGLLLVLEPYRGLHLWQHTDFINKDKDTLICFNSVPKAASLYERLGFVKLPFQTWHHTLLASSFKNSDDLEKLLSEGTLKKIDKTSYPLLKAYHDRLFPNDAGCGLRDFLHHWGKRSDATLLGYFEKGLLKGYGITTRSKKRVRDGKEEFGLRIAPLYADSDKIGALLVRGLVSLSIKENGQRFNICAPSCSSPYFLSQLKEMGFVQDGINFMFSNPTGIELAHFTMPNSVFAVAPLEFTHELIAGLTPLKNPKPCLLSQ